MTLVPDRYAIFKKVIESIKGSCSIILSQVDPDALAAAFALADLIMGLSPSTKIKFFYGGAIGHPQNQTLFNKFDLQGRLRPMKQFSEADNKNVMLVDSSSLKDGRLGLQSLKIDPIIVIDHHRDGDVTERDGTFVWIDTEAGAASTMLVELIQASLLPLTFDTPMVPSLLAVGIYTDTHGLIHCSARDRSAYGVVADIVGANELSQLFQFPLPASYFENEANAWSNRKIEGGRLVTYLGVIRPDQGDDLSTIADKYIRMPNASLVIVWALVQLDGEKAVVRISARSTDLSLPLGAFLRECFPEASSGAKLTSDGVGIGGGTIQVDFGPFLIPETRSEAVQLAAKYVLTRVFAA